MLVLTCVLDASSDLRLFRVDVRQDRHLYKCAPTVDQLGYQAQIGYQDSVCMIYLHLLFDYAHTSSTRSRYRTWQAYWKPSLTSPAMEASNRMPVDSVVMYTVSQCTYVAWITEAKRTSHGSQKLR
jgi:hypothetical protein